jgi:hypothetical protein
MGNICFPKNKVDIIWDAENNSAELNINGCFTGPNQLVLTVRPKIEKVVCQKNCQVTWEDGKRVRPAPPP